MSTTKPFFLIGEVSKGVIPSIEEAFRVLCQERGISFADFYNNEKISLSKSYASKIRRGLIIPPLFLRIKIAEFFKVDSSVIWNFPEIILEGVRE